VHEDILKHVHDKGQGTGPRDEVGEVLYNRGLTAALTSVEGVRRAQERFGKKPVTGDQVRWGLENLALDARAIEQRGFKGFMTPLSTSCVDHMGGDSQSYLHTWDGKAWQKSSDMYTADMQIIRPMVRAAARQYATEKKVEIRDCAKEASK
jgi:branched-chain amino acid transport system substrate-binding protein